MMINLIMNVIASCTFLLGVVLIYKGEYNQASASYALSINLFYLADR